jgi:ubiquitin carboxyl-terminal hydrolase 5/13
VFILGEFNHHITSAGTNCCRHYVAFIREQIPDEDSPDWVLFNDEKVVKVLDVEEMKKFAYVYFFKRV